MVLQITKSVKKFAAIAATASALVAIPVLAQGTPEPSMEPQPAAPSMETQPAAPSMEMETKPGEMKPETTPSTSGDSSSTTSGNIVDVASSNKSFTTLTAALKAAGLDKTLAAGGPYTVFAPTDEAFAALPKGALEQLLKPENKDTLIKILTYHVVQGEKDANTLKTGETTTLEGAPVQLNVSSSGVTVNGAKVLQADIKASNGVIHVIDKVILPPRP